MTARLSSLSTRAQVALLAGGLLLVALLVYVAVISPKRSTAVQLKQQTAAVQAQIEQNRSTAFTQALPAVRAASVFRLSKAMPTELETPNVILQINRKPVSNAADAARELKAVPSGRLAQILLWRGDAEVFVTVKKD